MHNIKDVHIVSGFVLGLRLHAVERKIMSMAP